MEFKITNIETEKTMNGVSTITAEAQDENKTKLKIGIPNRYLSNRNEIKERLTQTYAINTNSVPNAVYVGEII
jgi:hypothetical protein